MELYLSQTIRSDLDTPPDGYSEFIFCREFNLTPEEMDRMDSATVALWFGFLNAEAKAGKLRDMQSSLYGR